MAVDNSPIEWTDATWNPTTGCTKVSPGCANCYIVRTPAFRIKGREFVKGATDLRLHEDRLDQPLRWRKPRRIFVNSLSDLFHEDVPDAFIDRVFAVMGLAYQHTLQVLTKRAERMLAYVTAYEISGETWDFFNSPRVEFPPKNVWLGVSVENQHFADERIPLLLQTPAAVRFISAEPLLGATNLAEWLFGDCQDCGTAAAACDGLRRVHRACCPDCRHRRLDWVIAGGESGPGARPMHPDWARSIRDQCVAAGVPFFFKQWGEWTPGVNVERNRGTVETATWFNDHWLRGRENLAGNDGHVDDEPDLYRVGKKAAGGLLDGRTWDEFPAVRT
jgi:protein gp37